MTKQTPTKPAVAPKTRADRVRAVVKWLSIIALCWSSIGFFIVPLVIRHVGIPQLNKHLNGRASLARAACNPYSLGLILEGFRLEDSSGKTIFGFDRFDGRFEFWASIFYGGWRFERMVTQNPVMAAEIAADGSLNFLTMIKEAPPSASPKAAEPLQRIPRIVVHDLRVLGADASYTDHSTPEPFVWAFTDADFAIPDLDTNPTNDNPHSLFAISREGESFSWEGQVRVDPLSSTGRIEIKGIELPRFVPYILRYSDARITEGKLAAVVTYEFSPASSPQIAKATLSEARVTDFHILQPDGELLKFDSLGLNTAELDVKAHTIALDTVVIDKPAAASRRDKDGRLNLLSLIREEVLTAAAKRPGEPREDYRQIKYPLLQLLVATASLLDSATDPWELTVKAIDLKSATLDWSDLAERAPVHVTVSAVDAVLGPLSSEDRYRTPVTMTGVFGDSGRFKVSGDFSPLDIAAEVQGKVDDFDLAPFAPYLPEQLMAQLPKGQLTSATASLDGKAAVNIPQTGPSLASFDGRAELTSVLVENTEGGPALTKIERLSVNGKARADGQGRDIAAASWQGDVDGTGIDLDAPLDHPLRLTVGDVKVHTDESSAVFSGEAEAALSWKGTIAVTKADGGMTGEAQASAKVATVALEGVAQAKLSRATLAEATWNGTTTLTDVDAQTQQPGPAAITLASMGIRGEARVQGGEEQKADWKGVLEAAGVSVRAGEADATQATMQTLKLDGAARGVASVAGLKDAGWSGTANLGATTAQISGPTPASVAFASMAITGDATAQGGEQITAEWKGTLNADDFAAKIEGERPGEAAVATLTLDGEVQAVLNQSALVSAQWAGTTNLGQTRAEVGGADPASAGFKSVAINGAASVQGGEQLTAGWKGTLHADELSAKTGGDAATETTIGAVALDGEAAAPLHAGPRALTWSGSVDLTTLASKIAGAAPVSATVQSVQITGDSRAEMTDSGVQKVAWKGELRSQTVTAQATPDNPIDLTLASATVTGEASAADFTNAMPDLRFTGDAQTGEVQVSLPQRGSFKATVDSIIAKSASLSTGEKRASLADLLVDRPVLTGETALLPPPTDAKAPPEKALILRVNDMVPYDIVLTHAKITNASYDLVDPGTTPPLHVHGKDGDIEISNLSTDGSSVADINLTIRSQETGQVRLTGKLDLFRPKPFADVRAQIAAMPLKPYDAVAGRYAGYLIDRGHMAVSIPLKIEDGRLKGSLDFDFDKLYLGKSVDSPDAPGVPLELGLAILRDSRDHVKGQIGLTGNLEEPGFSVAGLIVDAFVQLIVKAATAPFQILGSLIGGEEGEDLSFIPFDPGLATMPPAAMARTHTLGTGLADRPALKLDVIGRISEAEDLLALRKVALRERVLADAQRRRSSLTSLTDRQYAEGVMEIYHESRNERVPLLRKDEDPPVPLAKMEPVVLAAITIPPEQLAELRLARAQAVIDALVRTHPEVADRVAIAEDSPEKSKAKGPRADLRLK